MDDNDYCEDDIGEIMEEREQAERSGVFEGGGIYDTIEEPDKVLHLTEEQEYELWRAASSLSRLAEETNSSLSDLLRVGGLKS